MNREQYMRALKKRLMRLPKEDFQRAVEYFEEYFDEAGPEQEQQAIADLGTPEEASTAIIEDFAIQNIKQPAKSMKKGINAVWVGILAVFMAPIALPFMLLAICILALIFIFIVMIFIIILALLGSILVAAPLSIAAGISILTKSIPAALVCIGSGLAFLGIDLLLCWLACILGKKLVLCLVGLFGEIVKKRKEKKEAGL